jgi:hypothetical protein
MAESAQQGGKLNAFISYSRDDLAFADQLDAALGQIERQHQVEGSATITKTVTTPFNEDQQKTIKWALENLEKLLVDPAKLDIRPPSDLIAVKLRARAAFATSIAVRDPPMLWASWDALRRLSNVVPNVNFARELWNQLAWSAAWGPYLAWPPQGSNVEDYLKKQAPTLPANLANSPPAQSAFRDFAGSQSAPARPSRAVEALEGKALSDALFIPDTFAD